MIIENCQNVIIYKYTSNDKKVLLIQIIIYLNNIYNHIQCIFNNKLIKKNSEQFQIVALLVNFFLVLFLGTFGKCCCIQKICQNC